MKTDLELIDEAKAVKEEVQWKKHSVASSPFTILENVEDKLFYVVLGDSRTHEGGFDTFEEAEKDAKDITWDKILHVTEKYFDFLNKNNLKTDKDE